MFLFFFAEATVFNRVEIAEMAGNGELAEFAEFDIIHGIEREISCLVTGKVALLFK